MGEKLNPEVSFREVIEVPIYVELFLRRLTEEGYETYVVGGAVRDSLLGREDVSDWDIATSARPQDVTAAFEGTPVRVEPTGLEHGTVTLIWGQKTAEVTTFRRDIECDGRYAEVEYGVSLAEDLRRRDFTCNALAYDPLNGRLQDPCGGLEDLRAKRIRTVGDPRTRFREDYLRLLRAVRFAVQLEFRIEENTFLAIKELVDGLENISSERIQKELSGILTSSNPHRGIRLLSETGMLAVIIGELEEVQKAEPDLFRHLLLCLEHVSPSLPLRVAALFHDLGKYLGEPERAGPVMLYRHHGQVGAEVVTRVLERLRFPARVIDRVRALIRFHTVDCCPDWGDGDLRRLLFVCHREGLDHGELLDLLSAVKGIGGRNAEHIDWLKSRMDEILKEEPPLSRKELAVNGHDVMEILEIPSGPRVGKVLDRLWESVLESPEINNKETLRKMISELGSPP